MVGAVSMGLAQEIDMEAEKMEYSSPFEHREGEVLVVEKLSDGFGRYIELDELQSEIVKAVNILLVANKQLIKKQLNRMGVSVTDDKLSKELLRLAQNHYLNRMAFQNTDGSISILKVYQLGRKAKGYFRYSKVQKVRLEGYVESRNASQVKKLLAANQALLGIAGEDLSIYTETAKMFCFNKQRDMPTNKLFRSLAFANTGDKAYIIQPLRNDGKDNVRDLVDKLDRIEAVIKKRGTERMGLPKDVTVLVVIENSTWMEYYEPVLKKLHFSHFKLATSYDRLMNSSGVLESKIHYIEPESFWKRLLKVS